MRHLFRLDCTFAAVAILVAPSWVAGQAPQNPPPPPNVASPRVPDSKMSAQSAPVTLTGCLERAGGAARADAPPTSPAATTPATGTAVTGDAAPYVLRTSATGDRESVVYHLFPANDSVTLADHVGHRVEINAVLKAATNSQAGMTNAGVSPQVPSGSTGMETMPQPSPQTSAEPGSTAKPAVTQPLFVSSVKMLDGSCR